MSESLMVVIRGVRYRREDAVRLGLVADAPGDTGAKDQPDEQAEADVESPKPAKKAAAKKKPAPRNKARKAVSNKTASPDA